MNQNRIFYDCRWSDEVDEKFINDFVFVQRAVFGDYFTKEMFHKQFVDNIYGSSIVVVVYIDKKPSASRALWRNDIDGRMAFQPGSTCVLEACRGKGVFSEMTRQSVAMLPREAIIFNFPNKNSYPGYIKLGWKQVAEYRPKLLLSMKQYRKEHPLNIDFEYANWWLKDIKGIKRCKWCGHYFLVRNDTPRPFFHILGHTDARTASLFPKVERIGICFYQSSKVTFYNKNYTTLCVVTKGGEKVYIPNWKIDAI